MGQHKHNPVAMMAKNGELPPEPKKMGKREAERFLYAKLREIICNHYRDGFSYNGIKLPPLPDAEEWGVLTMSELCCSTCNHWTYDRWTESKYGMGVGICGLDCEPAFCDRSDCLFHSAKGGADHE